MHTQLDPYNATLASFRRHTTDAGPLEGKTVAIKDNICLKGEPTTCASRILEGWRPPYDATVVTKLLNAGATLTAKTNMDEFAMGGSTEHSAFGPTLNPYDISRVPGGSSGGSAAAVSAGLCDMALGSDTGGSVRQPASFCGVVGLKPTYGLVSRYGLVAYASSLDQIGPITKTVEDCATLLAVIAGHDDRDSTSANVPIPDYNAVVDHGAKGLRVGIIGDLMGIGTNAEIRSATLAAAATLEASGANIGEVSLPSIEPSLWAYYLIATAEASSNLARFDGVRYGNRVDGSSTEEMMVATRSAGFGAEVRRRIILGTFALSAGYSDKLYGLAQQTRTVLIRQLNALYESYDVLLGPTSPVLPFKIGDKINDPEQMYLIDLCTVQANLSGQPAISVPAAMSADGLPIGVQFSTKPFGETDLLRTARVIEANASITPPRQLS